MEKQLNKQEIEIDIGRIFKVLWKKAWIIGLVGIVLAVVGYVTAYFLITPVYSANVKMYVNNSFNDEPGVSSSQISAAQDLTHTYMVILKSRNVLVDVANQCGLPYTADQIMGMMESTALNRTELFQGTVKCTNYKHAATIANTIADVMPGKVEEIVKGTSVRVVDRAVENPNRVDAGYTRYGIIGGAVGVMLTILIIIVADVLDTTIVSETYLTTRYGETPLLAVIPGIDDPKASYYKGYRGYYKGYYQTHEKQSKQPKSGGGK